MTKERFSKMMVIFMCALLVLTGCGKKDDEEENDEGNYVPVETMDVSRGTLRDEKTYTGKVVADKEVAVIPKVPGKVQTVNAKLGDRVSAGQTLFVVDQTDIQKQVDNAKLAVDAAGTGVRQAESSISAAQAGEKSAKDALDNVKINLDRMKTLYEEGAIPKSQLEELELQYSSAESQYEGAKSQVTQANIGIDLANDQLNQAKLAFSQAQETLGDTVTTAPISGILTAFEVKQGQMAGQDLAAMIVDPNELYVEINVIESVVNQIKEGQDVRVIIPAASTEAFNSKIDYISASANPQTKLYLVKIKVNNKDNMVKPGMTSDIELDTDEIKDVISINRDAVLRDNDEFYVYVVEDNKAVKKDINVGVTMGDFTEVKSGLSEGDKLIVKGHHYVEDGSSLKVMEGDVE